MSKDKLKGSGDSTTRCADNSGKETTQRAVSVGQQRRLEPIVTLENVSDKRRID